MKKRHKEMPDKEVMDRYCPICGEFVKLGSPIHRCDPKILNDIDKEMERDEDIQYRNIKRTDGRKFHEAEQIMGLYGMEEDDENNDFYEI